jgi:hypothetical protein
MKVAEAKPFDLDPEKRRRVASGVSAKTFPIAAEDARAIDQFVEEFTRRVVHLRRRKPSRRRAPKASSHRLP